MYLLQDQSAAPTPMEIREQNEDRVIRIKASRIYTAILGSPLQLNSGNDEAIPTFGEAGEELEDSRERWFRLGRATAEQHKNAHFLDEYGAQYFRELGLTLRVAGWGHDPEGFESGDKWQLFDGLVERGFRESQGEATLALELFRKYRFGGYTRVKGHLQYDESAGSIAGYNLIFVPSQRGHLRELLAEEFNAGLKVQHYRNILARDYLDLPRAQPLSWECFFEFFRELCRIDGSVAYSADPESFLGFGRGPAPKIQRMELSHSYDSLRAAQRFELTVSRCSHCGAVESIRDYRTQSMFRPGEHSYSFRDKKALSGILSRAHRESGCEHRSQPPA